MLEKTRQNESCVVNQTKAAAVLIGSGLRGVLAVVRMPRSGEEGFLFGS